MLIFINLVYYHLSLDECYLKGPNAFFDLGEKKKKEKEEKMATCVCLEMTCLQQARGRG